MLGGGNLINIDYTSSKAIYEQIYDEIARLILSGALKSDEQLPSVRELAALTKVNPNTIQKTYKSLEIDNYIYTVKGKGNFVKCADELRNMHIKKTDEKLCEVIKSLKELGISKDKILEIVDKALNQSNT